ncbi:MAG: rhomboid family intramembrane serine protease [Ancrocorticia sp.]|nr:rhomboid family intramembrane serine protease [Ancrocorticia sp.]MCI2002759.1 rhomboid family intramembrane serine protease [Ancrocorticia sp.]MCI2029940.1 rhomboid family intramembrane serine protease [Ancrocorticia sp.]MCI2178287.1 rhomboid family intramembrane serine protease [Ancrocorticia sp.]MCI2193820.1 rhomboid family intramembrane serine protease [Ancrocorticia sp.]
MATSWQGEGSGSRAARLFQRVGRALGFRGGNPPLVTLSLIGICVLVAIAELFFKNVGAALLFVPALAESQPYRFIASAFVHAGFWHLLFNMYALWLVGAVLEPAIGRVRFASIYLLSAVAGNVAVLLSADQLSESWITATVGASGAVFGVFGALFVLMHHFGTDSTSLLVVIVANLALGFLPGMNISWQSHVGGLIAGAVMMALMMARRQHISPRARRARDTAVIVGTAVVLCGLIWWGF